MIDIPQLIADFEACIGWPYKSPGTNDDRGIDCSGMFVRAFRLQGESIYHGSNTIWRRHLAEKGPIRSASDLQHDVARHALSAVTAKAADQNQRHRAGAQQRACDIPLADPRCNRRIFALHGGGQPQHTQ